MDHIQSKLDLLVGVKCRFVGEWLLSRQKTNRVMQVDALVSQKQLVACRWGQLHLRLDTLVADEAQGIINMLEDKIRKRSKNHID